MNARPLLRVASSLLAITAAGHTYGFLKFRPPSAAGTAVFDAMNSVTFEVRGHSYSYGHFYLGFGLTISVYLMLAAYLAWHIGSLAPAHSKIAVPMAWALTAAQVASVILSVLYFSLPPAILSTLTAVCLAWAAVRLSGSST